MLDGMSRRKLRIVWSAAWCIAGLLLAALWVRSMTACDVISKSSGTSRFVALASHRGTLYFLSPNTEIYLEPDRPKTQGWHVEQFDDGRWTEIWAAIFKAHSYAIMPHGFAAAAALTGALLAWLPWRYSLRTMLIAMTLVALALGALVLRN
jgi:hypothetical protein